MPATCPPNARFWDYVNNNPVKLTLRPGQSRSWGKWERTDEGWSSEGYTWSHEGDGVRCQYGSDGMDCDGRLRRGLAVFAPLAKLRARQATDGPAVPAWEDAESWQRDYAAEAAGY